MSDAPKWAFCVAVVGSSDVMSEGDLARLLDLLVNRHRDDRRIMLLESGRSPAFAWAKANEFDVRLIPMCGNQVKQDCELVSQADAVVVLGDPAPWRLLIWLCEAAKVPVRVYATKPNLPPQPKPAWDV